MRRIKYFVDAHVFDGHYQGSRSYLHGLYSELFMLMPEVDFFFAASDIDNLRREFGSPENVTFIRYYSKNKFIRLLFDIPYLIWNNNIDISHFQYISPLFKTSKEILTIHDILFLDFPESFPWWYRIKNKFLFKRSARRADLLLTVSEFSRSRICFHFKFGIEKIHVIPNGVLDKYLDSQETTTDICSKYGLDKYILCVSRIEPRKNQGLLIQAFRDLSLIEEAYQLVFIGAETITSPEIDAVLSTIDKEKLRSILFLKDVPEEELRSFYRNCRLFVYPSRAEGFGIPPLEAVICGASVICSGKTAMSDFSFFGDRIFDPYSLEDLKIKIRKFLAADNPDKDIIRSLVKDKYCWKSIAMEYVKTFKTMNY